MTAIRRGATLMEVLVAMLIMSIGLIGTAALFPISIVRSVQANVLTNGTTLRFNAESFLRTFPQILNDPDGNGTLGDQINSSFIVDPLGMLASPNALPATVGSLPTPTVNLRYSCGLTLVKAQYLFILPDNWVNRYEQFASASTTTSSQTNCTVPGLGAQNIVTATTATSVRAVIFNGTGTQSQTRIMSASPLADAISWADATKYNSNALPTNFGPIGNVRIESQDARYTWLYTANQASNGLTAISIVAFFKRATGDPSENTTYTCGFSIGSQTAAVSWAAGTPAPYLKKGSYVLDAVNMQWYRIVNFTD